MGTLGLVIWVSFCIITVGALRWQRRLLAKRVLRDKGMASIIVTFTVALVWFRLREIPEWHLLWLFPAVFIGFALLCRVFPPYMAFDRFLHRILTIGVRPARLVLPRDAAWDVFISYKAEDIDIVRRVTHQLIASGLKVWFAEYQVPLAAMPRFQEVINHGIAHSKSALLFTNDRYAQSPYCHREIKQILEILPSNSVCEIMIPPEKLPRQSYPKLNACPSHVGRDVEGMLAFIGDHMHWSLKPLLTEASSSDERVLTTQCRGREASLRIGGWEITNSGAVILGSVKGLELSCKLAQRDQLLVNLFCGAEISKAGQRIDQGIDDRRMFESLVEQAVHHTHHFRTTARGVHLLFQEELSQFAVTYYLRDHWTTKYSITIPNRVTKKMAEFVFTTGFSGSFEEYCLHVPLVDRLVRSLRWT